MDWDNYLLEEKSPGGFNAQLGTFKEFFRSYDLAEVPANPKVIDMTTPVKKSKKTYINMDALAGHTSIEAISSINSINPEQLKVFSTMPNLKYLHISSCKQEEIPDISCLNSLKVLILSDISKATNIEFVKNLSNLKSLYICNFKNLHDLSPLSSLRGSLKELAIIEGSITTKGKPVKSIEPLTVLTQLQYLVLYCRTEDKNNDISSLVNLKKLKNLFVLDRYTKKGQGDFLVKELPRLKNDPRL